jgi:hypothetical protein
MYFLYLSYFVVFVKQIYVYLSLCGKISNPKYLFFVIAYVYWGFRHFTKFKVRHFTKNYIKIRETFFWVKCVNAVYFTSFLAKNFEKIIENFSRGGLYVRHKFLI